MVADTARPGLAMRSLPHLCDRVRPLPAHDPPAVSLPLKPVPSDS